MNAKAHHEKVKIDNALSDMSLELTGEYANLWILGCKWGVADKTLQSLEKVIFAVAKEEWGKDTEVEFEYIAHRIQVRNGKRGKTFEATDA